MRGAYILVVCSVLLTAQETRSGEEPSPAEKRQKKIAMLLEAIESGAASEPPQIAIDSYIRTSNAIRPEDRAKSLALLQTGKERLPAFHSEVARASFTSLLGQEMAELDPDQAEELCTAIPRSNAEEFESDPKSACWANRIAKENKIALRAEVSLRALADGAYSTSQHATTATQLQKADPEQAAAFLSAYLAGFPERTAGLPELKGMVGVLRAVGADQPALSRQALELAVRSMERKDFPEPKRPVSFEARVDGKTIKTTGARDSLAFQLADLAWLVAPDLLESHQETLGRWKAEVTGGDWQRRRVTRFRESESGLDASLRRLFGVEGVPASLDNLDPQAARSVLESTSDPQVRVLVLISLLSEQPSTPEEKVRLVAELTANVEKLAPDARLRLLALVVLMDEALDRQAVPAAAKYGKALITAFDSTLGCDTKECEEAAMDMQPGDMVHEFISFLDGKGLEASALEMSHRSIDVRERIQELARIVEEAKPKKKPKDTAP